MQPYDKNKVTFNYRYYYDLRRQRMCHFAFEAIYFDSLKLLIINYHLILLAY